MGKTKRLANAARKRIKRAALNKKKLRKQIEGVGKSQDSIDYASYLARAKRRLSKKEILSYPEYLTAREGLKAKGDLVTPLQLVQRQAQDGYTDKEIEARWAAHKRRFPEQNLTRSQFISKKAWKDFDDIVEVEKEKYLKEGKSEQEARLIVWRGIMSPQLAEM